MAVAPILLLRRAIVAHLRADATVTALIPAARIYGARSPATPVWPFVRYGVSDAVPAYEITAPLHVFSKADFTDEAVLIADAIGNSLDEQVLGMSDGRNAHLRWAGARVIPDAAEASAFHAIVTIAATVARECAAA